MNLRVLKALADPTRFHIVEFLSHCLRGKASIREDGGVEGPTAGEVCCHITGADKISSTVSHHLHELESAGIVRLERKGKTTLCTLISSSLLGLSDHLINLASGDNQTGCC